jgi:cell division protein FtsI/penicillin-binding protein 2
MGGKTGTAQNPHGNEHSWFVGFAPVENPEIVAAVIVEQAGHGSTVAAPFVRTLILRYLEKLGGRQEQLVSRESPEAERGHP